MNIKLYNAAAGHLRATALESIAVIDSLLKSPSPPADAFRQIADHALRLVQHEGALLSLHQYFQAPPQDAHAPPQGAQKPSEPPVVVTPEMSSTYRKSLQKEKIKASAAKRKKKDE
jgi:hypothetical protein